MIETVGDLLEILYQKGKKTSIIDIETTATAQEAASQMTDSGINLLVVVENGNHVGVVSSSDTSGEFGSSLRPSERLVADIMTRDVVKVKTSDDIMEIPRVVTDLHNIRHLIVANDEGRWIAVLSSNEILWGVMENIHKEEQLLAYQRSEERRVD